MAFMLGSFTGGLFQGAQSIFSLYDSYQGVLKQVRLNEMADEAKKQRDADEAERQAGGGKQRGLGDEALGQPATSPGAGDAGDGVTRKALPAPATEGPASADPDTYAGEFPLRVPATTRSSPAAPGSYSGGPPAPISTAPSNMPTYDVATGLPRPQSQMSGAPFNAAGVQGAPGTPSGQAVIPNQPTIPSQMSGSPYNAAGVSGYPGTPSGPPAPIPPPVQPVGGYLGQFGPQSPAIPSRQPGAPYTPPPQQGLPFNPGTPSGMAPAPEPPPRQSVVPVRPLVPPMPGGPGAPGGRVPLASLGSRILQAVNPVGSAQAAEPTGQEQPTGLAPPAPMGSTATNAQVVTPPATVDPRVPPQTAGQVQASAAQPTALTPAQSPASAPAHSPPAPVAVAGTGGKVVQSEPTPVTLAPPVNMSFYRDAEMKHPERLAMVERAIAKEQAVGIVSPEFMLATIGRENPKWDNTIDHGTGSDGHISTAKGLVQIVDDTRRGIDPRGELDWRDPEQNIRLGVRLYKDQAVGGQALGSNTVQNALVYRGGPKALAGVARLGWDGYAATSEEARSQVEDMRKMFPTTPLGDNMVPAGSAEHKSYDLHEGTRRAHTEGPDGFLSHLTETGPAGLGMTDRWRVYQGMLEDHLIRSGHPEQAPMAAEWTAQMSHQGAVSNLIAADQALLSGNADLAGKLVAKSYAFFPDNAWVRTGTDQSGNLWVYQVHEGSTEPLAPPMKITHEMLAQQIIGLQNPVTYVKTLQQFQKTNAEISLAKSHAQYYEARPEIEQNKRDTAVQIAGIRQDTALQVAGAHQAAAAAKEASRSANMKDIDKEIETKYPSESVPEGTTPEEWTARSEVYRALRLDSQHGGGGMGPTAAATYAAGITKGDNKLRPISGGYRIEDKNGAVRGTLSQQEGDLIKALPGLKGSEPLRTPGTQQHSALGAGIGMGSGVGAGLGSMAAMNAGYGQTLTGLPVRRMQPAQPVTQAA